MTGALAVRRPDSLSRAEEQLLDDLARQAALVLDRLSVKTAQPTVGSIFTKLWPHADSVSNRRVPAALQDVRAAS